MTVQKLLRPALLAFALGSLFPLSAGAGAYQIDARTEAQAYQIRAYRGTDPTAPVLLPRRRVVQYLGVNGFELVTGEDLTFESSLRLFADFGLPTGESAQLDGLRSEDADLLYAHVRYRRGGLDVDVGRQTYLDLMDLIAFDGARVRYVSSLGVGAEAYAGLWVKGAGFLSSSVYQLDGTRETDARRINLLRSPTTPELSAIEPVFGAKLLAVELKGISGAVGYRRGLVAGKVDAERAALELQYGRGQGINGFGGVEYDLFQGRLAQARLQGRLDRELFAVSVELLRLQPSFSADSIFYYFAYAPRDEVRVRGELLPPGPFRFYAQGTGSRYNTNLNPDLAIAGAVGQPGDSPSTALGGSLGGAFRQGSVRSALDLTFRNGFGGRQTWVDLSGGYQPEGSRFSVDGRLSLAAIQDGLNPLLRGNFYGLQAWASYQITDAARASLAVEENVNPFTRNDTKVFLLFDVRAVL